MTRLRVGEVELVLDPSRRYMETRWADGLYVPATPTLTTSWQQTVDHEWGHTILAQQAGLPWSPVLRKVAEQRAGVWDGLWPNDDEVAREEARVLAWQATLNDALRGAA